MLQKLGSNTIFNEIENSSDTTSNAHQHIELEDTKFDVNIWDMLGLKKLGREKHNCLFDCAIKSLNTLEKCNKSPEIIYEVIRGENKQKCKYRSYKNALECAKKCYNLNQTTQALNNNLGSELNNILNTNVKANNATVGNNTLNAIIL